MGKKGPRYKDKVEFSEWLNETIWIFFYCEWEGVNCLMTTFKTEV